MAVVRDTDRGYKKLLRNVFRMAGKRSITVGIHDGEGGAAHGESGASVADVATIHEFGLNGVERSFIRAWFDANKPDNDTIIKRLAQSVIRGKNTPATALEKAGTVLAASAQGYIQSGSVSPATDKEDGTTLIDDAQLVGSITHKVE